MFSVGPTSAADPNIPPPPPPPPPIFSFFQIWILCQNSHTKEPKE